MARWTPDQRATLDSIVDEVLGNTPRGRRLIAVHGSGAAEFADLLAARFSARDESAVRASMNSFLRPRAERGATGVDPVDDHQRSAWDVDRFRRYLVDPFRLRDGAGFVLAVYDDAEDSDVELRWTTAPDSAVLIVDGDPVGAPALRGLWHARIWLDPIEATGVAKKELAAQRASATILVDNTDRAVPRRIFADSC